MQNNTKSSTIPFESLQQLQKQAASQPNESKRTELPVAKDYTKNGKGLKAVN